MTLKTHNRYIVIEGIDGSGKDTLVDHLWQTTLDKLAVDQPNYAAYRRERGEG